MIRFGLVLGTQLAAYWHAWLWYAGRVRSAPEEVFGFAVTLSLLFYLAVWSIGRHKTIHTLPLAPFVSLLLLYSFCHWLALPALLRTAIAVVSVSLSLYLAACDRRPPAAFWGLALLSLPLVPSLQFYLGYPARLISAGLTVPLLQLNGLAVQREGTYLIWQSATLQFDAPCSGVVMLWGGLFLTLVLAFLYRFNGWQTAAAVCAGGLLVLCGNVLRAASLFYLEALAGPPPRAEFALDAFAQGASPQELLARYDGWHEGVGVIAFSITAIAIVVVLGRFQAWSRRKIL